MATIFNKPKNIDSPMLLGMQEAFTKFPLPVSDEGSELSIASAFSWIQEAHDNRAIAPLLGFEESIDYTSEHINSLAQLLKAIVESDGYKGGNFPIQHVRAWQELQGKVIIEKLAPEIEQVAGNVLTNVANSRTRIGDILDKPKLSNYAKAGISAGSFGIMGLFQYRFLESLFHAIAQHDINQGKTSTLTQLVENHGAMLGTGIGWTVFTACTFAYLVKEGFETHLSDKIMGTKRWGKKSLCALGCAALLGIEMTGSFSRITIGTDLKEQVVDMKKSLGKATNGQATVFATLDSQTEIIGDQYTVEGEAMYKDEAGRGGVGPYAAAKQASYLPKSQLDFAKIDRIPGLRQKVEVFYKELQKHTDAMIAVQSAQGITVPPSKNELSAPGVLYDAGYHVKKTGSKLGKDAEISVDDLLASHNLLDPSLMDVVSDLVLDSGKKLHPQDVNALRKMLDQKIEAGGKSVDAVTNELDRTIDTIDAFMKDMTTSANAAYKSQTSYSPKVKPQKIDTSSLKNALNSTKTPVTVLDPFGVWGKFIELSSDGTIPFGYTLALLLRVLLVEGLLLSIGYMRVRQTHKSLSTPGAHFEDLARETDGQYLKIIDMIEKLTGGEAWKMLNGKALTREETHTLITTALTESTKKKGLGNHMSVVDEQGRKVSSTPQKWKELLGAAFFGQYSAPEIRRLKDMDDALMAWKVDITGEQPKQNQAWLEELKKWGYSLSKRLPKKKGGDTEDSDTIPNTWDAPIVTVEQGEGKVRLRIQDLLAQPRQLNIISNATQKRHANEDVKQKKREWVNASESIGAFLRANVSLKGVINDIRADKDHSMYSALKTLDDTGDILGYYKKEFSQLTESYRHILGNMTEEKFFSQEEVYESDIANSLKTRLAKLRASGLLNDNQNKNIQTWLHMDAGAFLSENIHIQAISLIEALKDQPYVVAHIASPQDFVKSKDLSRDVYIAGLQSIRTKIGQAEAIKSRIKSVKKYMSITGENVTELEIISVRNAAASIKKFLEDENNHGRVKETRIFRG